MNRSLLVIILVVALDAIGIGLIFPILPSLLEELTGHGEVSTIYGVILAAYAAMQFLFAPILGLLSDRIGRRPVLIVSLAGAAIDYLIMAFTPALWVLVVGRIIAGITSANMSVAGAYIADVTSEKDRARSFSWMSAAFGVGFIVGPILGGLFSSYFFLRAPFLAAAVLNALNLTLVFTVVKESRMPSREKVQLSTLNPFAPLKWAFSFPALVPLLLMFLIFAINGDIPGTIAVLYGQANFHFDSVAIGLWLAMFGLCHALAQALITGPLSKWLGDRGTLVFGVVADVLAFLGFGFATQGWMAFALSPLSALGGVGLPALQSLMSKQVSEARQGELQGVLASAQSLTSIAGPLIGTTVFFWTQPYFVGAIWLVAAALYLLAIPIFVWLFRRPAGEPVPASG